MKLSEAITRLTEIQKLHGDIDFVVAQRAESDGIEVAPFVNIGFCRLMVPVEKSFACVVILETENEVFGASLEEEGEETAPGLAVVPDEDRDYRGLVDTDMKA